MQTVVSRCLFVLSCCVLFAACASGPTAGDDGLPPVDSSSVYGLPVPEQTRLLVRIDPTRSDRIIDELRPFIDEQRPSVVQGEVAELLEETEAREVAGRIEERLDESRSVLVAISMRDNEELLRHLENGVAPVGPESIWQGLSARVFIPSTEAAGLKAEIAEFCDGESRCPMLERLGTREEYAVVDLHRDLWREFRDDDGAETYDEVDGSYWGRRTPALKKFVGNQAAVSMYVRGEDLPVWGGANGSLELVEALMSASPEHRGDLMARGTRFAGQTMRMASPEVREFEDTALTLDAGPEGELNVEYFRTFTRRGAESSAVPVEEVTLEVERIDDALAEGWWMPGTDGSEEGEEPGWMRRLRNRDRPAAELAEMFRRAGVWAYLVTMTNYPSAFFRSIGNMPLEGTNIPIRTMMTSGEQIVAARVGVEAPDGESGAEPSLSAGRISLLVEPDSKLESLLRQYSAPINTRIPGEISLRTRPAGDYRRLDVTFGDVGESGGETRRLEAGSLDATIDLGTLVDMAEAPSAPRWARGLQLGELFGDRERVRIRHRRFDAGLAGRIDLGTGPLEAPTAPAGEFELAAPDGPPACLETLREESARLLEELVDRETGERVRAVERFRSGLREEVENCGADRPTVADELRWMESRWARYEGHQLVRQLRWEEALARYDRACEAGAEGACDDRQRLRDLRDEVRMPRVARARATLENLDSRVPVVSDREVKRPNIGLIWPATVERVDREESEEEPAGQQSKNRFGESGELHELLSNSPVVSVDSNGGDSKFTAPLMLDRRIPVEEAVRIVDQVSRRDLRRRKQEAALTGRPEPEGPLWTAFVVDSTTDQTGEPPRALLVGGARHLETVDRPEIEVAVDADGIDLVGPDGSVSPVESCPAEGPTLCLDEEAAGEVRSVLEESGDAEESSVDLDRLAEMFSLDVLAEALEGVETDQAPVFVIRGRATVPFGLVARLHAALGAWSDERFEAESPVVLTGQVGT